jgi:hypothetical protein
MSSAEITEQNDKMVSVSKIIVGKKRVTWPKHKALFTMTME